MEYYKKEENYEIVGICMETHRILGPGLFRNSIQRSFRNRIQEQQYPF